MKRNWVILIAVAAAVTAVLLWNLPGGGEDTPTATGALQERPSDAPANGQSQESAPKKGWAAPAFELPVMDGTDTYRVGGPRDKALIVNFWASWCGPCDLEAPDLVKLYDHYQGMLDLYAVNAANYDKIRNAREFVQEKGFKFPVLIDGKGEAGNAYKVFAYPTSFIIDRNGKIVERIEGVIPLEQWKKYLDEVTDF